MKNSDNCGIENHYARRLVEGLSLRPDPLPALPGPLSLQVAVRAITQLCAVPAPAGSRGETRGRIAVHPAYVSRSGCIAQPATMTASIYAFVLNADLERGRCAPWPCETSAITLWGLDVRESIETTTRDAFERLGTVAMALRELMEASGHLGTHPPGPHEAHALFEARTAEHEGPCVKLAAGVGPVCRDLPGPGRLAANDSGEVA